MLRQGFLAKFELMGTHFGPWKIAKCLEFGLFWYQKRVKMGQNRVFPKMTADHSENLKQVFLANFDPIGMRFGAWKIPKCLENVPLWEPKLVKNGSQARFCKSEIRPFGLHKQLTLAHLKPVLTQFNRFRHMYAPSCTLRTYLTTVWWSHLELGRGI